MPASESEAWLEETKHVFSKADPALTESVEAATAHLMERGHQESEARRLAEFLNEHDDGDDLDDVEAAEERTESSESSVWDIFG